MAQLVIAAAGAAIGGALLPGVAFLGMTGAQLGWMAGSMLGSMVAGGQKSAGPRLDELRVTGTEYGGGIPWLAGAPRVPGDLIWASDRRENAKTEEVGKGGGSEYTTYTYEVDALYLMADNVLQGMTRVFLNGKLIWTLRAGATSLSLASSDQTTQWRRITFYPGGQSQLPDPTYEAAVANAPAYTGRATVFIEGLQLGQSGSLPNLTFEACADAAVGGTSLNTELARILSASTPDNEIYGMAVFADPDTGSVQFYISSSGGTARAVTVSSTGAVTLGGSFSYYRGDIRSLGETDELASLAYKTTGPQPYNYTLHRGTGGSGTVISVPASINTFSIAPVWALRQNILYVAAQYGGGSSVKTIYRFSGATAAGSYTPAASVQSLAAGTDYLYALQDWASASPASTDLIYVIDATSMTLADTIQSPYYPNRQATGRVLVNKANELFYVRGNGLGTNAWWKRVNGAWVLVSSDLGSADPGNVSGGFLSQTAIINNTLYVVKFASGTHEFVVYRSNATLEPGAAVLRDVVESLCERAGMPAGTYDASALASITQPVRALAISGGNVRQALEILRTSHGFDAYLTDKLYFVPRGGAPVLTIDADDLGAGDGDASDQPFSPTINADLEIPNRVAVVYRNMDADQINGTEQSDRGPTTQDSIQTMQLAIGMKPAEARGVADAVVRDAYASRITASVSLPMGYTHVTPTDVVQVPDTDGTLYRMRVTRRQDAGGILTLDLVGDDGAVIVEEVPTSTDYTPQAVVEALAQTVLVLLDIPLLRDADDGLGIYIAVRGTTTRWPGCIVYSSQDGTTFGTTVADITDSAVLGTATSVLATWARGEVLDRGNTVLVDVGPGELSSATLDQLQADADLNAALVGSEILRFTTATLQSTNPNVYRLSGLLRGQRGTEWAVGTHVLNERFVLLRARGLRRLALTQADIGQRRYFKAVTKGTVAADSTAVDIVPASLAQKPLAPVDLRAARDADGNLTLTWKRRTRYESKFIGTSGSVVPLGETAERYDVEILSGTTVLRSISVTDASMAYTATMQTSDFGGLQGIVTARVYQVGANGRGYPLTASVGGSGGVALSRTVTLGGAFTTGLVINVRAGALLLAAYTVKSADTNLAGVATALASAISAGSAGYTAAAVGAAVTVTGPVGVSFTLSADVGGPSSAEVNWYVQKSADASAGTAYSVRIAVVARYTWGGGNVLAGTQLGFTLRVGGVTLPAVQYLLTYDQSVQSALTGLQLAFQGSAIEAAGYQLVGNTDSFGFHLRLTRRTVGYVDALLVDQSSGQFCLQGQLSTSADQGTDPVASAQPQISDVTIYGTPAAGEVYRVELGPASFINQVTSTPTNYDYTALSGDAPADVATGLAALITAATEYDAATTDRGLGGAANTVRITGAYSVPTAGALWSVRAFILRAITTTIS